MKYVLDFLTYKAGNPPEKACGVRQSNNSKQLLRKALIVLK
jgi:hypothetical protein